VDTSSSNTFFLSGGITEREAAERFRRKPLTWRFRHRGWEFRRRELLYLPVYAVEFVNEKGVSLSFAVDGREGRWCFLLPPAEGGAPEGALLGSFDLSAGQARETARRTLAGLVVMRAFGRRGIGEVRETSVRRAGYPLWVEYYRKKDSYDVAVLDGVRGTWAEDRVRLTLLLTLRQGE